MNWSCRPYTRVRSSGLASAQVFSSPGNSTAYVVVMPSSFRQ